MQGNLIYYYFICERKLWFYSHKITMEHEEELVKIGKYIELFYKDQHKYERNVIVFNEISPDVIKRYKNFIIVLEVKKSSKMKNAALWQLKFYLWYLKKFGLNVKGKLIVPREEKEELVEITEEDEKKLKEIIENIKKIINMPNPPRVPRKPYCKYCSYRILCWKDEL
ncbi:MAG: CRISPR-associated protein Cas4 [Candidatus Aenigmatarchaeota archaeon]